MNAGKEIFSETVFQMWKLYFYLFPNIDYLRQARGGQDIYQTLLERPIEKCLQICSKDISQ